MATDQKAFTIVWLLTEEVLPLFGILDFLLSDCGTNLLAHVVQDVCQLLGTDKLNTTAYHPQCDGMVERMNRTYKGHVAEPCSEVRQLVGPLSPGVLWAYRNTPHEVTKEKPSVLLFRMDLRSPTEAALLPADPLCLRDVTGYCEELILSMSSARELAATNVQAAQWRYKQQYDKTAQSAGYQVSHWVLVRFPAQETVKKRKLFEPWHGSYRILARSDPDVTDAKVQLPEDGSIKVHQLRVCPCPPLLLAGFYWYVGSRKSPGRVPQWM